MKLSDVKFSKDQVAVMASWLIASAINEAAACEDSPSSDSDLFLSGIRRTTAHALHTLYQQVTGKSRSPALAMERVTGLRDILLNPDQAAEVGKNNYILIDQMGEMFAEECMKSIDVSKAGKCWQDAVDLIEGRPAVATHVGHGISRGWSDKELFVDFGNVLGPFEAIQFNFRDPKHANEAYCMGLRVEVKVVTHPEHDL